LIRKVPAVVAFMHTGTRLTAGYRYTTLGDATAARAGRGVKGSTSARVWGHSPYGVSGVEKRLKQHSREAKSARPSVLAYAKAHVRFCAVLPAYSFV